VAHPRKLIRAAVVAALKRSTIARDNVHATRIVPYRANMDLPVIAVYTLEDKVDPDSIERAPRELKRHATLTIEAWVKPGDNVDDAMDDFEEQIQKVMHADPYFKDPDSGDCIASDSIQVGSDMEVIERGEKLLGILMLEYDFTYWQLAPEAPTTLDDFTDVHVDMPLTDDDGNPQDPGDAAADDFIVQVIP